MNQNKASFKSYKLSNSDMFIRFMLFSLLIALFAQCRSNKSSNSENIYSEEYISGIMMKAADWQLDNLATTATLSDGGTEKVPSNGWIRGAFFTGVMATYETTGNEKYLQEAISLAIKNNWKPGPRKRHADDHCISQMYLELYQLEPEMKKIAATRENFDLMIEQPMKPEKVGWSKDKNWAWCDALFMSPPAMVMMANATGDQKYLDLMNEMWWDTYDYLYDEEEHLFYRDDSYIPDEDKGPYTPNGKKVFWGRGNGWVLAGLTRVLIYMPEDYPDRPKYVKLYSEMCERLAKLQLEDGLWRSSLNDPKWFPAPETSSSGFICYALAWGVNNGLLSQEKFVPTVKKAWKGLTWAVRDSGRLAWVQTVGHDPREVDMEDTMEYGVGAFLLAGSEIIKLFK